MLDLMREVLPLREKVAIARQSLIILQRCRTAGLVLRFFKNKRLGAMCGLPDSVKLSGSKPSRSLLYREQHPPCGARKRCLICAYELTDPSSAKKSDQIKTLKLIPFPRLFYKESETVPKVGVRFRILSSDVLPVSNMHMRGNNEPDKEPVAGIQRDTYI